MTGKVIDLDIIGIFLLKKYFGIQKGGITKKYKNHERKLRKKCINLLSGFPTVNPSPGTDWYLRIFFEKKTKSPSRWALSLKTATEKSQKELKLLCPSGFASHNYSATFDILFSTVFVENLL